MNEMQSKVEEALSEEALFPAISASGIIEFKDILSVCLLTFLFFQSIFKNHCFFSPVDTSYGTRQYVFSCVCAERLCA